MIMLLDGENPANTVTVPSVSTIGGATLVSEIMNMVTQFTIIGGALWAVWGVVVLAGALKDKNGPGLQAGIWQLVGGVLIIVAAAMFKTLIDIK